MNTSLEDTATGANDEFDYPATDAEEEQSCERFRAWIKDSAPTLATVFDQTKNNHPAPYANAESLKLWVREINDKISCLPIENELNPFLAPFAEIMAEFLGSKVNETSMDAKEQEQRILDEDDQNEALELSGSSSADVPEDGPPKNKKQRVEPATTNDKHEKIMARYLCKRASGPMF